MTPAAIRVESVGKRYLLGVGAGSDESFSQRMERLVRVPMRRVRRRPDPAGATRKELWALRDVSFELEEGGALGLVGANGAGKSTLLKLISQITLPSEGRITLNGRIGTLIEVGTGFHPELTGRENVYLNGVILGMRRSEIARRFDEIVEFSGVERFLETPVKRYSSGMYVRLAFSVAVHFEPEILLVDEVLSVGDAEFQRKCLEKMEEITAEGRTIIFVSHNLPSVQRLCDRAVLIEKGRLLADGSPEEVAAKYLSSPQAESSAGTSLIPDQVPRFGSGEARLRRVDMRDLSGVPLETPRMGQPFRLTFLYEVMETVERIIFEVGLCTVDGQQFAVAHSTDDGSQPIPSIAPGMREVTVELPVTLLPHEFSVAVAMHRTNGVTVDHVEEAHRFAGLNTAEPGVESYPWSDVRGFIQAPAVWGDVTEAKSDPASSSREAVGAEGAS